MEDSSVTNTGVFRKVFRGVEVKTLQTLRKFATVSTYPPETILCHQGAMENTFYVVVAGQVAIVQDVEGGQQRFLALRGPGEYFGELALIDNASRHANCVTLTETTVLELTEDVFDAVLEESPVVAYNVMHQVLTMLRQNDRAAIEDLTSKNKELSRAYDELRAAQASIVEKERLERELEIAADVQRTLLPESLPSYPDYRFAAFLRPAQQVGGDFYDVVHLDDEHAGILIADVVDKSVHAALFMAVARTLFRTECRRSLAPADVAQGVHRGMRDVAESADIFVTAFYGVLHRPTCRLRYVIAGHEKPLVIRGARSAHALPGSGRFLGMIDPLHLREFETEVGPGDRLLLFSDGVTDATNEAGEPFGHQQLREAFNQKRALDPGALLASIASAVDTLSGGEPQFDYLKLVVVDAAAAEN
jgi:serine phosphatase RsbU (regulator of sigma subunit)